MEKLITFMLFVAGLYVLGWNQEYMALILGLCLWSLTAWRLLKPKQK